MRVIAGAAKGRKLKGPPSSQTRPMADKIREALFSSLQSLGIQPSRVLDLYAGTGSVGIEALSRGAQSAVFVDRQKRACTTIAENLERTGYRDQSQVICSGIDRVIVNPPDSFDFVVIDPPYADLAIAETLEEVGRSSLVQSDSIVVLGHWPRFPEHDIVGNLRLLKRRCHGDSCFSIFEVVYGEGSPDGATEHR